MINQLSFKHPSSWLAVGCLTWLQAINGSPGFWSLMEQHYNISNVQLNNLIVAWEIGRLFGCFSGIAGDYISDRKILLIGLIFGLVGYGLQYLYIEYNIPHLSYWHALLLTALAGNSTCWINTYCYLLALKNFSHNHITLIAITSSYSGLSGKIYTYFVEITEGSRNSLVVLPCLALATVGLTVVLISNRIKLTYYGDVASIFPVVFAIAITTGVYAVTESIAPMFAQMSLHLRALIMVLILMLPHVMGLLKPALQFILEKCQSKLMSKELNEFIESTSKTDYKDGFEIAIEEGREADDKAEVEADQGKDCNLKETLINVDFWLFYLGNACGATLGAVYLNNLEQISDSRGSSKETLRLLAISYVFGFFGRIFLVMLNWYTREKPMLTNQVLTVLLMMPMPVAFFLLAGSDSTRSLYISTGVLGTCSGALSAISATKLLEQFAGKSNSVVKQTIVLTNIPIGFFLFGYLAAFNYEKEGVKDHGMCKGLHCHYDTLITWGSICFVGTILSFVLHLRTHKS